MADTPAEPQPPKDRVSSSHASAFTWYSFAEVDVNKPPQFNTDHGLSDPQQRARMRWAKPEPSPTQEK